MFRNRQSSNEKKSGSSDTAASIKPKFLVPRRFWRRRRLRRYAA